jgi:hypothetical protein
MEIGDGSLFESELPVSHGPELTSKLPNIRGLINTNILKIVADSGLS